MSRIIAGGETVICGGGIVGLTLARELLMRGHKDIIIIEKEQQLGKHASGRNSGVLHAGIYYSIGSLRGRTCLAGNFLMKDYCKSKGIPLLERGKVIVTKNEAEIEILETLYKRARENGARVELVDEKRLKQIEPFAKTCKHALYSHYTAVTDSKKVLKELYNELIVSSKVKILLGTRLNGIKGNQTLTTNRGLIKFGTLVNAAGAWSDELAHIFGIGLNYRLVPFKGIYKKLRPEKSYMVRSNIYPVPDTRNPFLGVHFTRNVSDEVLIGPTAMPALGAENYGILGGIDKRAPGILLTNAILFLRNPEFKRLSFIEVRKYKTGVFYSNAKKLVKGLEFRDILPSQKVGIRPQLIDWNTKQLVMDFVVLKDGNSLHVLNAISPGFTSSMSFAKILANELETLN
ncbi:MAG: L-2-hydroxyglutarate oxidase [Deltaproteobacteria bacterium]|nr:MAG: L-2-hydroxyglutarate oxidase [Deltaproteobacteria bacterium]